MDNIEQGFYLFNVVPRVLRKHWREFFLCNVVWSLMDNIAQGFYLYRVIPRVLPKITLNKCFSVQCCLEALGQHYTWFLPIQCCPKSIRTTLNMIFSCAVLSEPLEYHILNVVQICLRQHCARKLLVQCWRRPHNHLFTRK